MASDLEELVGQVRTALEEPDLAGYKELLAPDVRWGPADEPEWGCRNRGQVLSWYRAARERGVRATVEEVVVGDGCLLVGLTVATPPADGAEGATTARWQVLTVTDGQVSDIRGFDDRQSAAARAGVPG